MQIARLFTLLLYHKIISLGIWRNLSCLLYNVGPSSRFCVSWIKKLTLFQNANLDKSKRLSTKVIE